MRFEKSATARILAVIVTLVGCDDEPERGTVVLPESDASVSLSPCSDAGCGDPANVDNDRDGFSENEGDCDDNDALRGPGAVDIPGNGIEDDCKPDGDAVASPKVSCDQDLRATSTDEDQVAKALGLCGDEVSRSSHQWGLIEAAWLRIDGSHELGDPSQVWLPERFGAATPTEGKRLVVLSTGAARDAKAKDYTEACDVFGSSKLDPATGAWSGGVQPPEGYPRDSSACSTRNVSEGALAYDDVGLELELRAPANATGVAFDSIFYTYEYPDFVCSRFNDFFVVLMDPAPRQFRDDNIVFDENEDPIGVNAGYLASCRPTSRASVHRKDDFACEQGASLLAGTGYDAKEASCAPLPPGESDLGGASTGWLHTEVPVVGGARFKLHFILWDSGDPLLDSTVALDNLHFITAPPVTGTKPLTSG